MKSSLSNFCGYHKFGVIIALVAVINLVAFAQPQLQLQQNAPVQAATSIPKVGITATVNPSQIHIGDHFTYRIEVKAPQAFIVDLPELVGNLANFEVKDLQVQHGEPKDGIKAHVWELKLSTFIGGDFVIPPQVVEGIVGTDTLRLATEPVTIRVLSRINSEDQDILDIDEPIKDPHTPWWVWVLAAIPLLALLVFLIIYIVKKWRKSTIVYVRPPYDEAKYQLRLLRERNLLQSGEQALYFYEFGQILRRYLHGRFNVDVLDATTQELSERLASISDLSADHKQLTLEFARESDMIKFAKSELSFEEYSALEIKALRVIDETRPMELPRATTVKSK